MATDSHLAVVAPAPPLPPDQPAAKGARASVGHVLTRCERRAAASAGVGAIAVVTVAAVPASLAVRHWLWLLGSALWGLGSLAFGGSVALHLGGGLLAHGPVWRVRRRSIKAMVASVQGFVQIAARRADRRFAQHWFVWPLVAFSGLIVAALAYHVFPGRTAAIVEGCLFVTVIVSWPVLACGAAVVHALKALNVYISLRDFVASLAGWIALGAVIEGESQLPPLDTNYFTTLAQINVTLLVAGIVVAAPVAWSGTQRLRLTWILTGPMVAVIGLAACIVGSVSAHGARYLFVLSIAPIGPITLSLMFGAYERLVRGTEARPRDGADVDQLKGADIIEVRHAVGEQNMERPA